MAWPGGKDGSGVAQRLINEIPPHEIFVSAFLGDCAILRRKRPAELNVGIDLDRANVERWRSGPPIHAPLELYCCDAIEWLRHRFGLYLVGPLETPSGSGRVAANGDLAGQVATNGGAGQRRGNGRPGPPTHDPATAAAVAAFGVGIPTLSTASLDRAAPAAGAANGGLADRTAHHRSRFSAASADADENGGQDLDAECRDRGPRGPRSHKTAAQDPGDENGDPAGHVAQNGDGRSRHRYFVYADPPYLMSTRRTKGRLYNHELGDDRHLELLATLQKLPCLVMVSHYPCELYDQALAGWRSFTFAAQTRGGARAIEKVWCNYPPPATLHDARYLGLNKRQRERVRRRVRNWTAGLARMHPLERQAVLDAIAESIDRR